MKEYDFENITIESSKKILCKCNKCRNDWESVINKRVGGTGCPKCSKLKKRKCTI